MTYQEHLLIAQALRASIESFSPADRIAYQGPFYSVALYMASLLEFDNPDEFRKQVFMRAIFGQHAPPADPDERVRRIIT